MSLSFSQFKEQVFSNMTIKKCLFHYQTSFHDSMWNEPDGMAEFSQYDRDNADCDYQTWHKTKEFIASQTEWIYSDFQDNLYGLLDDFIVQCDNEGTFSCFSKGFHNIPFILAQQQDIEDLEYRAKKYQANYHVLLNDYKKFCETQSLVIDINDYTDEFNQFVSDKIKN
jgi:hypothetical protein